MNLEFDAWDKFHAGMNKEEYQRWLHSVAFQSVRIFKRMSKYPPASSEGEYPAQRTGRLRASIRGDVTGTAVVVSTNTPYSKWLREGTSRMGRRKMSDNALEEGIAAAGRLKKWAGWKHG